MIDQSVRPARRLPLWPLAVLVLAIVAGAGAWLWRSAATPQPAAQPAAAQAAGATQTNEGGQVTVAATWQGRAAGPLFSVALNTHAVDLDGYDLKQLAVLRIDGGPAVQATAWDAPKGGHHRSGTLTFPAVGADGQPVIGPGAQTVELVIRDLAGVPERSLRWPAQP